MYLKNILEILIAGVLIIIAFWILYKGIKRKKTGCSCDNCNAMCPYYRKKQKEEHIKNKNKENLK